jgi:hypothetical protein
MPVITVELVDDRGNILDTLARCTNFTAAEGAYKAITAQNPQSRYLLRQGVFVSRDSHPPPPPPPQDYGPGGWGPEGAPKIPGQRKRRWK